MISIELILLLDTCGLTTPAIDREIERDNKH